MSSTSASEGANPDPAIEAAVDLAVARGALVVAASGNDGEEGSPLNYPAAFPAFSPSRPRRRTGRSHPSRARRASSTWRHPARRCRWRLSTRRRARRPGRPRMGRASPHLSSPVPPPGSGRCARPSTLDRWLRSCAAARPTSARPAATRRAGSGCQRAGGTLAAGARQGSSEPDDDVDDVTPGREGYHGARSRTSGNFQSHSRPRRRGRRSARRVPVWLPRGKTVRARLSTDAGIALGLVRATAPLSVRGASRRDLLATSATRSTGATLAYRHATAAGFGLLVVTPATANTHDIHAVRSALGSPTLVWLRG